MQAVFPDKADEILKAGDPGEYGVESYLCRLLCVILFMTSIMSELKLIANMAKLLFYIPSKNEPWIDMKEEAVESESPEEFLEQVHLRVAGMSRAWKVFNTIVVLCPKCVLWLLTAKAGVNFLMETAGVDDVIVNSVALGFLLTLDEMVTDNLMIQQAKQLLVMCEPFTFKEVIIFRSQSDHSLDDNTIVDRYSQLRPDSDQNISNGLFSFLCSVIPINFILVAALTVFFVYEYYDVHCDFVDGRFISKTVYAPTSMRFNMLNAIFPQFFPLQTDDKPYWSAAAV